MKKTDKPFEETYQVVLCRSIKYGWIFVLEYDGGEFTDYVRISEPTAVRFQPLQDDAVIRNAVSALDAAERNARLELERKLAEINEQRAQLLALTHQPESAS